MADYNKSNNSKSYNSKTYNYRNEMEEAVGAITLGAIT